MKKVLLLGGEGFLGRATKELLTKKSYEVFTFSRRTSDEKNHYQGSILDKKRLAEAIKDKEIIINFVGLSPIKQPKISYDRIHVQGVLNILLSLTKKQQFIHISALGADPQSKAAYLRTKGEAETLINNNKNPTTILRPSLLYGPKHEFFKMIDRTKYLLFFPTIPSKTQPVYYEDVAKTIIACVGEQKKQTLNLTGEETLTIYELVKEYKKSKRTPTIPLPYMFVKPALFLITRTGLFGLGPEQYKMFNKDSITTKNDITQFIKPKKYVDWLKEQKKNVRR